MKALYLIFLFFCMRANATPPSQHEGFEGFEGFEGLEGLYAPSRRLFSSPGGTPTGKTPVTTTAATNTTAVVGTPAKPTSHLDTPLPDWTSNLDAESAYWDEGGKEEEEEDESKEKEKEKEEEDEDEGESSSSSDEEAAYVRPSMHIQNFYGPYVHRSAVNGEKISMEPHGHTVGHVSSFSSWNVGRGYSQIQEKETELEFENETHTHNLRRQGRGGEDGEYDVSDMPPSEMMRMTSTGRSTMIKPKTVKTVKSSAAQHSAGSAGTPPKPTTGSATKPTTGSATKLSAAKSAGSTGAA